MKAARARDLTIGKVEDFRSLTGQGVTGRVSNCTVTIGSERMLAGGTAPAGDLTARAEKLRQDGQTVISSRSTGNRRDCWLFPIRSDRHTRKRFERSARKACGS